jgi:hypothetical protein
MQEINIGVKVEEEGVSFFGTEEVNALLKKGHVVVSVEPGEVMVEEVPAEEGEDEEEMGYALAGFNIVVKLQPK